VCLQADEIAAQQRGLNPRIQLQAAHLLQFRIRVTEGKSDPNISRR
jgi:hypothetical protein